MWRLAPIPFLVHSLGMLIDEAWFHRRRGLPRWERWGHPLDTFTVLACYALALALPPARNALILYVSAAAFSSVFVTKDEWIHSRHCTGGEMWLHAALFVLHPVLLGLAGAWRFAPLLAGHGNLYDTSPDASGRGFFGYFLMGQAALAFLFLAYQLLYWNGPWKPALSGSR
jgi:hypothetical protein